MKKNIIFVCAAVVLTVCFGVTGAMAMMKDKCIELCTSGAEDNGTECSLVMLEADGWFYVVEGDMYPMEGSWGNYGGAFVMQGMYGCAPIFAGTKKRGFFECTGGGIQVGGEPAGGPNPPPEGFNIYTIKKVKRKNCEEIMQDR